MKRDDDYHVELVGGPRDGTVIVFPHAATSPALELAVQWNGEWVTERYQNVSRWNGDNLVYEYRGRKGK